MNFDAWLEAFQRDIRNEISNIYIPEGASELRRECQELFRDGRYEEGLARATRDPEWESDPFAWLNLGAGQFFQERYGEARESWRKAVDLATDRETKATALANIGASFYREDRFDHAADCFDTAIQIDPSNRIALLGRMSIADARGDEAEMGLRWTQLKASVPGWRTDPIIAEATRIDRSLRRSRALGLFEQDEP